MERLCPLRTVVEDIRVSGASAGGDDHWFADADPPDFNTAAKYWQQYVDAFGQKSFYEGLYEIFTGTGDYIIPGGIVFPPDGKCPPADSPPPPGPAWTFEDFDKFGALGIGAGGFGPVYPVGFTEIFRLMVNELESAQRFLQPSTTLKDGIRSLPRAFQTQIQRGQSKVYLQTTVDSIRRVSSGGFEIWGFTLGGKFGPLSGPNGTKKFDRVIVATTTRAMELLLGLTKFGPDALIASAPAKAIMRTHIVSSNKVAALINNFWSYGTPKSQFRCLQTDGLAHQVYTLDYTPAGQSPHRHGVCFISYVWEDDAVKYQSLSNGLPTDQASDKFGAANAFLYTYLIESIKAIPSKNNEVAKWAELLQPVNNDYKNNVIFQEWQSSLFFSGAFKLSQPGQDPYVQDMFFDYQKAGTGNDTGVYLAGDCIAWTSGWVEGALTTALNAAAGVIVSLGGTLNPDQNGNTPMSINSKRYNYFGPSS
jgi:tryptophan 2-monooxygenase